jgi:CheY-like chemotaxis protein
MLTGIIGSLDLMRRRMAMGQFEDLDRYIDAATTSAQRAAALTHRLLAFSRRQSLDPAPLDLNALIGSMTQLVERALPEQIEFELALAADLPNALADANQLENAILNLALNARDAMADGGKLVIETGVSTIRDLGDGPFVMVAVSDTGTGIPADVIEKVFDPFFTTKPIGQGTGLGLSMVYGFAQQSGGAVRIDSEPGRGTSVKLYLPTTQAPTIAAVPTPVLARGGSGERVLIVEDDQSVRMLVREVLEELRYEAVEIGTPTDAVPLLASDQRIDLMISDIGMPGMNGRDLATLARTHRPELPILFITGYAEQATLRGDFLGTGMSMVTKPFSLETLATRIGELIVNRQPA